MPRSEPRIRQRHRHAHQRIRMHDIRRQTRQLPTRVVAKHRQLTPVTAPEDEHIMHLFQHRVNVVLAPVGKVWRARAGHCRLANAAIVEHHHTPARQTQRPRKRRIGLARHAQRRVDHHRAVCTQPRVSDRHRQRPAVDRADMIVAGGKSIDGIAGRFTLHGHFTRVIKLRRTEHWRRRIQLQLHGR